LIVARAAGQVEREKSSALSPLAISAYYKDQL